MASTSGRPNHYSHGGRRNNSGCKKVFNSSSSRKCEWQSRRRIRLEENIYKTWLAARINAKQDMSVLVTAISQRNYYDLFNVREDNFCFSMPEDLVRDFFFVSELCCLLTLSQFSPNEQRK